MASIPNGCDSAKCGPVCACPAGSWVNIRTYDIVMKWERDDGAVSYGIMLEPQFNDFVLAMTEA